jgi:hypothetical protein
MQAGISGLGKSVRLDNYQVMRDFFAYAISDISPKIEPIIAKAIPKSSKKHDPRYHTDICEYRDSLPKIKLIQFLFPRYAAACIYVDNLLLFTAALGYMVLPRFNGPFRKDRMSSFQKPPG